MHGIDSSVRVNISLPSLCFDEVNVVVKKEEGYFNGRTDFVYSAIRSLMMTLVHVFKDKLDDAKKNGRTPLEIDLLFEDSLTRYNRKKNSNFSSQYPGPYVKQIPIRVDAKFYRSMVAFATYLDEASEQAIIQNFCRIAIMDYLEEVNMNIAESDVFVEELQEVRNRSEVYERMYKLNRY